MAEVRGWPGSGGDAVAFYFGAVVGDSPVEGSPGWAVIDRFCVVDVTWAPAPLWPGHSISVRSPFVNFYICKAVVGAYSYSFFCHGLFFFPQMASSPLILV